MTRPIRRLLVLGLVLATVSSACGQEPKPPPLTPEEQTRAAEAKKIHEEAVQLYERGRAAEAVGKAREALETRRTLYPVSSYPIGHPELAVSLNDLGMFLGATGAFDKAVPFVRQAMAMRTKLYPTSKYPDGHADLAESINNVGFLLLAMGLSDQALPHYERALEMNRRLYPAATYPDGHEGVVTAHNNMGFLLQTMGSHERALPHYERALELNRRLYPAAKYPDGHSKLALSISNLGFLMQAMGSEEKALPLWEQAPRCAEKLYPPSRYPDGHPQLAFSINNLGSLRLSQGSFDKALLHYEQALAMRQKLYPAAKYPEGHPELAFSFNNLGFLRMTMGSSEQARQDLERALAMFRRLYPAARYPDGHPDLAYALNNLGYLHLSMGSYEKTLPYYEQALAMRQKLYPAETFAHGHPDLAQSVNNMAYLLQAVGSYDKALPHYERALAMHRTLYPAARCPDGHPDFAESHANLGFLFQAMGLNDDALRHFDQALAMRRKLNERVLETASEAEALAFVNSQPLLCDAVLSVSMQVPNQVESAYGAVWAGKAAITRVLERRHAAARVAGTVHAAKLDELKGLRRRIDQLLQDRRRPPAERDRLLTRATDDRDMLERELATKLPLLQRAREIGALGPDALPPLLPDHAVLIDFVRYTRFDYDRAKPGRAGETRTASYAAFVLAKGRPIRRIDLGVAAPIDRAVARCRAAIATRAASPAATELHDRVWAKLAPHLPAGTATLYLSPDGDLARLPWAALPVGKDRVLLEDHALATVPHGPFVLEALKYPRDDRGAGTTLLLGGVDYNSATWPNLPGTVTELTALAPLAPTPRAALTSADATAARLIDLLPTARYAHFATHGYFDAEALTAERQRAWRAMETRQFGDDSRRVAGKNPLAFTGLVLAGGDVLSGLQLVDLPLEKLKLVTLSACETGLGEYTGGEGVQGLQRAFHLAGCPNVVASLWKVNDAATAALMAKFYHELWVNKQEPLAALREAQLTIYRRPDLIPDLAGERGAPKLKDAVEVKSVDPPAEPAKRQARADTKLWAAFVLSGVGK